MLEAEWSGWDLLVARLGLGRGLVAFPAGVGVCAEKGGSMLPAVLLVQLLGKPSAPLHCAHPPEQLLGPVDGNIAAEDVDSGA